MAEHTGIEWAESTVNFWMGCEKVSAGCAHCYAERLVRDLMGKDFRTVRRTSDASFYGALRWREPRTIFTCSLSDFFIEAADPWREEAWRVIRETPRHTWLILTKRPERIAAHLPFDWGEEGYPNVWLGVSGETVELLEKRALPVSRAAVGVRFASMEPWLDDGMGEAEIGPSGRDSLLGMFDWVILGGESGPGARPLNPSSVRAVRDACARLRVPFFFKQWGGVGDKRDHAEAVIDGRRWVEMPTRSAP